MSETLPTHEELEVSAGSSQQPSGQKKKREGPHRGPNRALKYKKLRRSQPPRLQISIPEKWGVVVGERAPQFVAECSAWVKEICPLDVENWDKMPKEVTDRLYGKIQSKYELPEGPHVTKALKSQCSNLYRRWRERLKKRYFKNNSSVRELERSCPSDIDPDQWKWLLYYWSSDRQRQRSEKNRKNALAMKIRPANGSKSIARIVTDLDSGIETTQANEESSSNSTTTQTQPAEPVYIQLWLKTKTHKDGKLDEEAEIILEKFRELHLKTIEEKGVDSLTIEDAYEMVLGHSSGHARGLGRGHSVPSKRENLGRLQLQHELEQFHQREEEARERERELRADFERKELQLRAEMEQKENEARERERELRAEVEKKEKEAMEREAKLRADLQAQMTELFNRMTGFNAGR